MRKFYVFYVMVSLALFLTSCSTYLRSRSADAAEDQNKKKLTDVMKLHTMDDGFVYFSSRHPGKLMNGEVTGVKHIPLSFFDADSIVYRVRGMKEIPLFAYSNGQKFDVFRENDLNLVYTTSLIMIPVSEIDNMVLKRNGNQTLIVSGLVLGISALSIYIISNMSFNITDAF